MTILFCVTVTGCSSHSGKGYYDNADFGYFQFVSADQEYTYFANYTLSDALQRFQQCWYTFCMFTLKSAYFI